MSRGSRVGGSSPRASWSLAAAAQVGTSIVTVARVEVAGIEVEHGGPSIDSEVGCLGGALGRLRGCRRGVGVAPGRGDEDVADYVCWRQRRASSRQAATAAMTLGRRYYEMHTGRSHEEGIRLLEGPAEPLREATEAVDNRPHRRSETARGAPTVKGLGDRPRVLDRHSQRRRQRLGGPAPLLAFVREGFSVPRRIRPAWRTLVSNS